MDDAEFSQAYREVEDVLIVNASEFTGIYLAFGGGLSLSAVLGNQVTLGCQAIPPVTPHIKAGRVRALAVTSAKRSALLPDVPTVQEQGVAGYECYSWGILFAPAKTPAPSAAATR